MTADSPCDSGCHQAHLLRALREYEQFHNEHRPHRGLSVGEVAERTGISQATASQQLTLLRRGPVVTSRRDGKTVYYRADRDGALAALAELPSYLATCY